jgi:quercetin dioxygenase-like cupin family protein
MSDPIGATVAQLNDLYQYAERGIVSKTLYETPTLKMVLMCFEPGQGLSEHTAPFEAVVQVLQGTADFTLGEEVHEVKPGSLFVMPPGMKHAVRAKERFAFLLSMVRVAQVTGIH